VSQYQRHAANVESDIKDNLVVTKGTSHLCQECRFGRTSCVSPYEKKQMWGGSRTLTVPTNAKSKVPCWEESNPSESENQTLPPWSLAVLSLDPNKVRKRFTVLPKGTMELS